MKDWVKNLSPSSESRAKIPCTPIRLNFTMTQIDSLNKTTRINVVALSAMHLAIHSNARARRAGSACAAQTSPTWRDKIEDRWKVLLGSHATIRVWPRSDTRSRDDKHLPIRRIRIGNTLIPSRADWIVVERTGTWEWSRASDETGSRPLSEK